MKQNYRFKVAYDGTRYLGWEKQPGQEMTIQGKIETVLFRMVNPEDPEEEKSSEKLRQSGSIAPGKLLRQSTNPVELIGAGRTDAGVHARGQVCNAYLDTDMTTDEIKAYMNHYLPEDIAVLEVKEAAERFHSRYRATGKTYCYTCYVGDSKPLFNRKYCWVLEKMPDVDRMKKAAEYLVGEHDFASFCGNPRMKKSTIRLVDSIEIAVKGGYLTLTFHGTGFLQYMVRILTGTLLEVGWGMREPESMEALLEAKDRKQAGLTAPPQGLCMLKVDYN